MTDFDWKKAGTPEQLAAYLETIAERMNVPHTVIAAQCIRGLADDNERLESEIEALREVLKVMLDECIDDEFAPHVMDARELLAARNQGGA